MRHRIVEIESLDEFDTAVAGATADQEGAASISGWVVQSVDLRHRGTALSGVSVTGTIFLGCQMPITLEEDLIARGALVFPSLPGVPFNPYRSGLYTAGELYGSSTYSRSLDGRVYAWYLSQGRPAPLPGDLAMSLHDQAIGESLDDLTSSLTTRLVCVMGGHAYQRGDGAYRFAAHLGAELSSRFTVATGGGPGAMEAVNLGARWGEAAGLDSAIDQLARVPDYTPDITSWAKTALTLPLPPLEHATIGIPTWFYGHEPPNVFATHIAKYFSNALREDVLLTRCRGGIVVLPGAAGTVQEIFQTTTGAYYATDPAQVTPLVLVGRNHWTHQLPAWPLLASLAADRAMATRIHLVDTIDEVRAVLR